MVPIHRTGLHVANADATRRLTHADAAYMNTQRMHDCDERHLLVSATSAEGWREQPGRDPG